MMIERITSTEVAEPPPGRWSNALRVGDLLFISGMVSRARMESLSTAATSTNKRRSSSGRFVISSKRRVGRWPTWLK